MSFIYTLGKETGKPPTAYFVRNLLNEADTLIASQMDICFGHPIILLALLVQLVSCSRCAEDDRSLLLVLA